MCKVEMFGAWLRMDTGATYRKLAKVLVTLGKRNIAEALCTARGMEFTVLECLCILYVWRIAIFHTYIIIIVWRTLSCMML